MANLKYIKQKTKNLMLYMVKFCVHLCYRICNMLRKHDHKKVVFVLSRGEELEGNLYHIHQEVKRQMKDAKIHFIHTSNKMNLILLREAFIISNAQYVILDDFFMPIYLIKPSKRLKVIQLWHAAGALKKFGHSTIGKRFGPNREYVNIVPIHSNYTHVYVSTQRVIPYYAEAFNMSKDNIFGLGIPRVDLFTNKEMKEKTTSSVLQKYPALVEEKVVILIAPTYRAKGDQEESPLELMDIIERFSDKIKKEVVILFKPHPYTKQRILNRLSNISNVIIEKNTPINKCMLISDAFITDFSSAVFDFSLLQKPIAHFVPDYDEYRRNRGFYQGLKETSDGEIIMSEKKLIQWINLREKGEYKDTTRMIRKNFDNINNVSSKIVNHFISE